MILETERMISEETKGINIDFFQKNGILDNNATGSGIYIIELRARNSLAKEDSPLHLYVGQSVYMVKRCGEHIYKLFNNPQYMGLTSENLSNNNLELRFRVLESIDNQREQLKEKELIHIKKLQPLTQSSKSDRQLKNKLSIVQEAIKNLINS